MAPAVIPAIAATSAAAATEAPGITVNEARALQGYPAMQFGAVSRLSNRLIDLKEYEDWSAPPFGMKLHLVDKATRVVYFGANGKPLYVQELRR